MLKTLALSSRLLDYEVYVPPLVQPLFDAVRKQQELVPIIPEITRDFDFDAFMSGVWISLRLSVSNLFDGKSRVFDQIG